MEILVAVLAFVGALLAAIAAVALVRRLREEVEGWLIAWTVSAVALCLTLGVIGVGYLMGFGVVTFKVYQLTGSLLAPLWLSIGLVQLLSEKVPPKFVGWLFGIAFTVVSTVVLIFDPVSKADEMGKVLPVAEGHWDIIPRYLLVGAHSIAGLIMLAAVVIAGLRWRNGDELDTDNLHAVMVIAPSGIAIIGAMRFAVPGIFATALFVVAAAGIWYTVLRPLAPYEDDDEDDAPESHRGERSAERAGERSAHGRRAMREQDPFLPPAAESPMQAPPQQQPLPPGQPRRSGLGDLVAEYRAGDQPVDYAARMAPPDQGPSTGYIMNGRHGGGPQTGPQDFGMPATGAMYPGADVFAPGSRAPQQPPQAQQQPPQAQHASPAPQAQPQQQAASSRPSPSIYGMLTVFTLMDGSGEAFDRLAELTVEAVRRGEPDTLIYACHAVKSAPLQRIVYELYRDEVAYRDHQRQPHVERFVNERQAMVLATNIIELNVNAAKVVPLPTAMY
ncbi:putative quinol monooxygenase [Nonomuraea guangzhouensis]|uniref:Quinol monooxygenase n=1 Tax=Nonomuraea guangzhouensis TaxID=1291555 RepID=A0ABW4GPS6_9ACTN|nr:antibiotic biosynthesis monooxygenase [Nonomuraea guangzhouensis]